VPDFIDVPIPTEPTAIANMAIARLTATLAANGYPGYVASRGNLEIIEIDVLSAMVADLAAAAGQVPSAIFRAFGTKLLNLPYSTGGTATVSSTWTLRDSLGHTINAGTYVTIGGIGFYVQTTTIAAPGTSVLTIPLVAVAQGIASNGLTGVVQPVDQLDFVATVVTVGTTAGGSTPETDLAYQNRLAALLALQTPRPVTTSDYAALTLSTPASSLPVGTTVGRATAVNGYNPLVTTFSATTTSGSATLTFVSSYTGITAGTAITGTGFPQATAVVSVDPSTSTLVLTKNATATGTPTLTATGTYLNEKTVGVFVTDPNGLALLGTAKTGISAYLQTYRELNFIVNVIDPTYTPIYVTYQFHALPNYDPVALLATVNAALASYINPSTWGAQLSLGGTGTWLNSAAGFDILRYNKVLGVIEAVQGVDYVLPGAAGLTIGYTAGPTGVVDLALGGPAPLPTADLTTPTIVGSYV
jgi:hypothetical protein